MAFKNCSKAGRCHFRYSGRKLTGFEGRVGIACRVVADDPYPVFSRKLYIVGVKNSNEGKVFIGRLVVVSDAPFKLSGKLVHGELGASGLIL